MANADGEILLGLQIQQTTALIQSQLNQISKNLDLMITGKLDRTRTAAQLRKDLKDFKAAQVALTGTLSKSKTTAQLSKDIKNLGKQAQVQLTAKIDPAAIKKQLKNANINIDTNVKGGEALKETGNSLDTINKKSAATVSSITLLHQAFNQLERAAKQLINTAAELDSKLTDLRMVTGDSYEETSRLVSEYNQMAKELGSTTISVIDSASEWLRQGKSIAETMDLIRQSQTLSIVGNMNSEISTKRLTSVMMGYKQEVSEVASDVDKLTALDMEAAVSADGLSEALSHTASSAYLAGLELDKILAYITVTMETTQKMPSVIGESFKSIFARMGKVTNGSAVDDMGEDISNVETTLRSLGIELRKSEDEFRNFDEILDDVGSKWNTYSTVVQRQIATAFGGVYQSENFLALMNNYEKVAEYVDIAANSAGTAAERFNAYQNSVQAHYNSMIVSAEALAKQTLPPELMNGILDASAAVLDFLTNTNLLVIALSTLGTALSVKGLAMFGGKLKSLYQSVSNLSAAFNILGKSAKVNLSADEFNKLLTVTKGLNAQQLKLVVSNKALTTEQRLAILTASGLTAEEAKQTLVTMGLATAEGTATTATFSLSGAFKALGAAIAANPIGFILTALTAAVTVIATVNSKIKEQRQEVIEAGNAAAEAAKEIVDLANAYFELSDAVDAGTASKEDMIAAQDDLINAIGIEKSELDDLITKYGDLKTAIIAATREELATDISLAVKGANTAMEDAVDEIDGYFDSNSYYSAIGEEAGKIMSYLQGLGFEGIDNTGSKGGGTIFLPSVENTGGGLEDVEFEDLVANYKYLKDAMNAVRGKFGSDNDVFKVLSDAYQEYADVVEPAIEAIDNSNQLIAEDLILAQRAINDPTTKAEFDAFRDAVIDNLESDMDWSSDGTLSAEGLVDSILSTNRLFADFMEGTADTMGTAGEEITAGSNKVKKSLEELWNSEKFTDTKKSILEMANSLDGINANNIDDLVSGSAELAAILEEDGMNAQFLAHILQTEAMGGDGFALITDDALKLNDALDGMKDRFDEVTDAKSRYDAALAGGEKDDNFKSYAEAFKALNDEFVAGYKNSKQFWAAAEYLFGTEQLDAWGWGDGIDEIYAAMQRNVDVFKDADSAGAGFLDRLYEISEAGEIKADDGSVIASIEKLSDGSYDFQFDSGNLDALAERLGITSEAATACMQALSMYGDFQFYDIQTVMDTIQEIGLASDAINGTAVNVGTLTDQLISLGYNNKDVHDLLSVLQEVDGVTLLDANAEVATLTQSLSDLGLAAQDGVTVTVNADGLADLMSQLNFTKDDTQNLITKLGEADGITLTNAQGEVVDLNDALAYTDTLEFASVTSELDGITNSADLAQQAVDNLQTSISTLKGKTITVTVDIKRKNGILGSLFGYANGTQDAPAGDALVGEEGEELVQSGNKAYLVGTNGPEITHLNEGDKVYTAEQTRKIKRGSMVIRGVLPAYAGGRFNTNSEYESVLPDSKSDNTSTTSTTKTTDKAESEFERLYKYHQHLMKMDQESVSDYIRWLDAAYQEAYKNGEIELDDYYKYQEEVFDKIKDSLDDLQKSHENAIEFKQIKLKNAVEAGDYSGITQYTGEIIDHYKAMQDEVHLQAEYYRSIGYDETSDEITKLKSLWWDYYEEIKNVSADAWKQVVDNANDAVDSIQGVYDTLKNAAQEFAENGALTVDTLQGIYALGVENLAYLEDENGLLVINEERIQQVIAARTQQMAIETALNYVQQLRTALTNNDTAALLNLTTATGSAATSTWELVYAQLQLLGLEDTQYNAALQRINTLRSLADTAVTSVGMIDTSVKESLEATSTALDDLLSYVQDMIKWEVESQIEALETQIDKFREICDLQKESLALEREKDQYTKSVAEKTKSIAELQARITQLDLDDSREAQAEKKKLQEQLAEENGELAELQADKAYESTVDMIDEAFDAYEKSKQDEIAVLEDTISSAERLYQLSISRIENEWDTLYSDLINWNTAYGTSTNQELTAAWNAASAAVQQYNGYLNAVAATQAQIASFEAGGFNTVGEMNDYDTSGGETMSRVQEIVAEMKANSKAHHSANVDGKRKLNERNLELGDELEQLIGRTVERGDDGVWYLDKVGGKQLYSTYPYSTYHTGGVVGDQPTKQQDEMFALLEKREAVFTEPQQKQVYRVLKEDETIAAKLGIGGLYRNMNGSGYAETQTQKAVMRDMQQAQSAAGNSQTIQSIGDVTVPVHVMVTEKLDKSDLKRLSREIGNIAGEEITGAFIRRGKGTIDGSRLRP